jgi:hypothetical protein
LESLWARPESMVTLTCSDSGQPRLSRKDGHEDSQPMPLSNVRRIGTLLQRRLDEFQPGSFGVPFCRRSDNWSNICTRNPGFVQQNSDPSLNPAGAGNETALNESGRMSRRWAGRSPKTGGPTVKGGGYQQRIYGGAHAAESSFKRTLCPAADLSSSPTRIQSDSHYRFYRARYYQGPLPAPSISVAGQPIEFNTNGFAFNLYCDAIELSFM